MKEPRTQRIQIKCTKAELDAMDELAELAVLTRTALILKAVAGVRVHAKTDMHTINELRRIGGLLKHTLNTTYGYGPQLIKVLNELREAILRVGR